MALSDRLLSRPAQGEKPDVPPLLVLIVASTQTLAEDAQAKPQVLFSNVHVFDGINDARIENANVLVEGNLIKQVSTDPIEAPDATIIDGGGRTMIPGLIDAHWHTYYCCMPQTALVTGDMSEVAIRGALGSEETLLRGFTTVRDVGGNPFSVKKMIDAGELVGPRILPSGPPTSQTSGHFDFRGVNDVPANMTDPKSYWERNAVILTGDGVPEVVKRAREVLRLGATQIKIATGGGVSSQFDPLDVQQYTFDEIKAFVDVAETWNTYVAAHVFSDKAIQTSIKAGVKSIEHGFLSQ